MEESSQLENLISKEINSMSMQDLKNKVIKLAQAYRSERIRNDYFEKSLKSTNIELAKNKKISNDYEDLKFNFDKLKKAFQ
jgi:hypothetical protein